MLKLRGAKGEGEVDDLLHVAPTPLDGDDPQPLQTRIELRLAEHSVSEWRER